MELREILAFYKRSYPKMIVASLIFTMLAVGVYFLPPKYIASGSFVVVRNVEPLAEAFSYEGYYAQLTSQDFSKNLISFFKNESVLQKVSSDAQIDRTELKRKIRVVKEAPSVSRLEVSHSSMDTARSIWISLRDEVLSIVEELNKGTDPRLKVFVIGNDPVLKQSYRNIYVFGATGAMVGFLLASFYFGLKEYLK